MRLVEGLRQLIGTILRSAEQIFYLFSILVLLMVIFALLGMEAFAKPLDKPQWEDSLYRYNDFPAALTITLVILSGENWNEVLYQGWGAIGPLALVYYAMVLVATNFIALNLFIAILISNIQVTEVTP